MHARIEQVLVHECTYETSVSVSCVCRNARIEQVLVHACMQKTSVSA